MESTALTITVKEQELQRDLRYSLTQLKREGIISERNQEATQKLIIALRAIFDRIIYPRISDDIGAIVEHMRLSLERIMPEDSVQAIITSIHACALPHIALPTALLDTNCEELKQRIHFDSSELPSGRYLMYSSAFLQQMLYANRTHGAPSADINSEKQVFMNLSRLMRLVHMIETFETRFGKNLLPLPRGVRFSGRETISDKPVFACIRDATDHIDHVASSIENLLRDNNLTVPGLSPTDLELWMHTPVEIIIEKTRVSLREKLILATLLAGTLALGMGIGMSISHKTPSDKAPQQESPKEPQKD